MNKHKIITEIPLNEREEFKSFVETYRKQFIRSSEFLVNEVFEENADLIVSLKNHDVSSVIEMTREMVWHKYLIEEEKFNTALLKDLHRKIKTPAAILDEIIENSSDMRTGSGEYAGRVYPYIYQLSLSNTNSRRSRSGSVFQFIIYRIYRELGYEYDSQKKVGTKVFSQVGLGKVVDSVLPGVKQFEQNRRKTIIGTMKTSLRERWQEVVEEIHRTNIPQIFLLTVDEKISKEGAEKMSQHNVTLVVPQRIKVNLLQEMSNIISFEDYFFKEIPNIISYWK